MNIVDIQCRTTSMNLGCRIMEIRILPGKFKKRRSRHGYKHISFKAASGSEQNLNKKCVLSDLPRNPCGHYDVPEKMASCCIMVSCAIKNMEASSRLRHQKKKYGVHVECPQCTMSHHLHSQMATSLREVLLQIFFSFQSSCTQGLPKEQCVCHLISWMGLPSLPTTNANWTSLVPYTVKVTKLLRKCRMIVPPHEKLVKHDKNEWTDSRNINQNILQRVHHEARLMDSSCAKLTTRDRTPWKGTSLRDMFRAGLTLGICTTPHSLSWTNIRTPKALRTCRTPAAKTDALDCHRQESKGKAPVQHTGRVKKHIVSCSCIALKYARSGGNTVCSPYSTVSTHTCV